MSSVKYLLLLAVALAAGAWARQLLTDDQRLRFVAMEQATAAPKLLALLPVGLVLLYVIKEISADLVILGSHGWSSEEHASLTERVIESAPCAVLTLHEGRGEPDFRLASAPAGEPPAILVPTDFSDSAAAAVG